MSASGDPEPPAATFATAIQAQMPGLRTYAAGLAGSATEADDLVQDALVRIWRYRGAFRPDDSLRGWMFSILKNEFRSQRRRRQPWVEDIDGRFSSQIACPPSQDWSLQYAELLRALGRLTGPNRQALLLVAIGLSYAEAAEACGCEVGVLKSRVHRARARLAKLMGADDPLPPFPMTIATDGGADDPTEGR